jgi:hypothetical protein
MQFSKKLFDTVYDSVIPLVKSKYADNVQIIFRQQIQPWHPSSTLVHEGGVAVLQTNPDKFWEFSKVWWHHKSLSSHSKLWHTTSTAQLRLSPTLIIKVST